MTSELSFWFNITQYTIEFKIVISKELEEMFLNLQRYKQPLSWYAKLCSLQKCSFHHGKDSRISVVFLTNVFSTPPCISDFQIKADDGGKQQPLVFEGRCPRHHILLLGNQLLSLLAKKLSRFKIKRLFPLHTSWTATQTTLSTTQKMFSMLFISSHSLNRQISYKYPVCSSLYF